MSNRFLELRSSGEYIDRTFFIPSLIKNRYVTLSRPRGLGSSVFCDMLEQYFLGLRENFRGLAIERLETEWRKSPVLSIDLKFIPRDSDDLRRYLFRSAGSDGSEGHFRSPDGQAEVCSVMP